MRYDRGVAVFCALIIVTATSAGPALAALPSKDRGSGGTEIASDTTAVKVPANASALELRRHARQELQAADFPGKGQRNGGKDKLLSDLNESFAYHTTPNRTSSRQLFKTDHHVAAATSKRVPKVSKLLAAADARLAETAIEDLERVIEELERRNISYDERRVNNRLSKAKRAYERGERLRSKGTHEGSIAHYRIAWRRVQTLLEELDRTVAPQVTIADRTDPPHNETITYQVAGRVFAIQPSEIDNVTVTVDGEPQRVPLDTQPIPGTNGSFSTNVSVSPAPTVINVTARETETGTDGDQHARGDRKQTGERESQESSKNGNGGESSETDEKRSTSRAKGPNGDKWTGSARLRLDGDGLPDVYEQSISLTDPLDPDSDASATEPSESGNGILDGLEDLDGDGLTTYTEYQLGTDPLDPDTDDDGLPDDFEARIPGIGPRSVDMDGDGIDDPAEDPDGDGLTNEQEADAGTNPFRPDTDRDRLNDSAERQYGTTPTDRDTDDDGLIDGEEVSLGTDPLTADTDGDGVLDGNETYTTTARNESTGVSVTFEGNGDVASTARIEANQRDVFDSERVENLSATPVVNLKAERSFDTATVTFEYEEASVPEGNESDLAVFRYNESLQMFVPLNTSIDKANDTVTAETLHFSTFVVFSVSNWAAQLETKSPNPRQGTGGDEIKPVDIVFIMDSSGSMAWNDPNGYRKTAAKRFVGGLLEVDRAGVVDFDHNAETTQGLTDSFDPVNDSIDRLDARGGTDIGAGIRRANLLFDDQGSENRSKIAILLSDGYPSGADYSARRQASLAADRGITIYTIGFGAPAESLMQDVARETGGAYYFVSDASDLPEVFSRVAKNATGTKDSDGDGFVDKLESEGIPVGFLWPNERIRTDPAQADTDGDGLTDPEEVGELVNLTGTVEYGEYKKDYGINYYRLESSPTDPDSDDDGVDDAAENGWGTDPLDTDSDSDGFDDLVDKRPTTEDVPPSVQIESGDFKEHVTVTADDESGISEVVVDGRYDPLVGAPFTRESTPDSRERTGDGKYVYEVGIYQHGVLDEHPQQYTINVTDGNGNRATFVVTPSDDGGVSTMKMTLFAGATGTGSAGATGGSLLIGGSVLVTAGVVIVVAGVLIGSAAAVDYYTTDFGGRETTEEATRPVPGTGTAEVYPVGQTDERINIPIQLPTGTVYEAPEPLGDGADRGFGQEFVKRTPGIENLDDIGEILRTPDAVNERGDYTVVIGDNPNAGGHITLYVNNGVVITGEQTVKDPNRNEWIEIPGSTIDKIANKKNDWDHNQIGNTEKEVARNIRRVIRSPDEIYEDPNQDRWLYVKKMMLHGREVIVTVFVMDDKVATAFVPTHPQYPGPTGYSDDYAKWYIKSQQMIKQYEPGTPILPGVSKGNKPGNPGQKPDPTK